MGKKKVNEAARLLGKRGAKKRWAGKTEDERTAHARLMLRARWAKAK